MDQQTQTTLSQYLELGHFLTWTDMLVYFFIFLVIWIVYSIVFRPYFSPLYKLPGKRGSLLLGSLTREDWKDLDPCVLFLKTMRELNVKSIFRIHWFFGWTTVCVPSTDVYKYVAVLNNKNYPKPGIVYRPVREVFGEGLVVLNGEDHAVQRKLCLGAFKFNVLKALVGKFEKHSNELVELWQNKVGNNDSVDMFVEEDLSRGALDSISDACFDLKTSVLQDPDSEVTHAVRWLLKSTNTSLTTFIPLLKYLPTPGNRKFRRYKDMVETLLHDMIDKRKEFIKTLKDDSKVDNLLTMLLLAEDEEDGTRLTKTQVRDQMMTFLFAGHETTAVTMLWCLWSLALNPRVQRKVRAEITSVLPDVDEPITEDHLDRMVYLSCVIKETLRFHSPVPIAPRVALNDDYLDGYFIPKGTLVFLLVSTIHHNPEYWEDPEEFYPERFEDESKIKPFSFIPFTSGPRMCIGYKLALMELQMFLANILRSFEFSPTPGMESVGKYFFTTQKPSKPILLKVTKLDKTT